MPIDAGAFASLSLTPIGADSHRRRCALKVFSSHSRQARTRHFLRLRRGVSSAQSLRASLDDAVILVGRQRHISRTISRRRTVDTGDGHRHYRDDDSLKQLPARRRSSISGIAMTANFAKPDYARAVSRG